MEFKQQYAAYQQAIEEYLNGIFTADKPYGRLIGGISGVKIHGHSSLANSVSTGAPSGPFISRTTCCSA